MKDHFVIMLLCEYIIVLLSIRPMGKPSFASSWIAHHVGSEGKGIKPKTRISPLLPWAFFCGYLLVREMRMRGGPISSPHKIQEEKRFDHCSYNTAS